MLVSSMNPLVSERLDTLRFSHDNYRTIHSPGPVYEVPQVAIIGTVVKPGQSVSLTSVKSSQTSSSYTLSALEVASTEQPVPASEASKLNVRESTYLATGVVWVPVTLVASLPVSL